MRKLNRLVQVSALGLGVLLAAGAQASLINIGNNAINVNGTVLANTLTGTVTYNGGNPLSCYAGIFSLAVINAAGSPTSGNIYTFCTDVGVIWKNSDTYTALSFAGQTGVNPAWANTPKSIQNASWLYNTYFVPHTSTYVSDPDWAAGMQLAIWKVLYDTTTTGTVTTGFTTGALRATGFGGTAAGGGIYDANLLLGYVNTARGNGTFTQYLDTWLKPNDNKSQGLIWNALTPVPEPTTMIAGALMLLPFGASMRRFMRKNRAA